MKHYNITVSGKVQGVFYRKTAVETGRELGIKGFVRNEKDGTVYIEAEGDGEQLEKFIEWCRKGPRAAVVSGVQVEEDKIKQYTLLEILR